ncbi:DUF4349 domain-containing protein [Flavobacteriaceae bacterium M23B6Z8]
MKLYSWFLFLLIVACKGSVSENDTNVFGITSPEEVIDEILLEPASEPVASKQEQKIILESYLVFETSNMDKTYKDVALYVKDNGGYIQSDQSSKSYDRLNRTIIARVPSENFHKVIDSISADVRYFDTKNSTATDVTEEFIDITARLKAKRALEERYLQLLNKAKNVKEILEIEKELSVIREEIESREGRLKYLKNKVSYSTLTVQFYKVTKDKGITISYGTKMWNAIKGGFNGLSLFFLGVLTVWPFIIILGILIFIVRKWLKRKNT